METATVTTVVQQAAQTNSFWDFLLMILLVLSGFLAGRFMKYFCEQAIRKTPLGQSSLRRTVLELSARSTTFPATAIGICLALRLLAVKSSLRGDVTAVLITIVVTYVVYQMAELSGWWVRHLRAKTRTALDDMMEPVVRKTLRTVTVILGLVQIAQQLSDKPITSILAGLGVGGLAVALAAQDTIKNFFGSLVIFADRPFQMGDSVSVDSTEGTVEEVGMRSTRLRTVDGHLVTIPNGELANKSIRNITRRPYIKRLANIAVACDTPPGKMERALTIIKEELNRANQKMHPDMPPRVHFNEFNSASLNIQVIYWFVPASDYWAFMEFDQSFNLAVLSRFNEEGIEFAFPGRLQPRAN
ncbi:MAG: mechanosensitive ion channel family protein [Kiritimatiellaceae bacterium]|nr:mechanosensitive ion channel family protein [Kiritimatiellaceae bacterium]